MAAYKYLIVGGGMTAGAAVNAIREADPDGSLGVIGRESDAPYNRPPLTKGLWRGEPQNEIWIDLPPGVELISGRSVSRLDPGQKKVVDELGLETGYEKLLLATGGRPRRFTFGGDRVLYYRTFADYQRLRRESETRQRFGVIGGGFIGSELAAALAMNGKDVVMVFPGDGIGSGVFPRDLSLHLNAYYHDRGVEVMPNRLVTGINARGEQTVMRTTHRETGRADDVLVDAVVAGLGIEPEVTLAQEAGLAIDNGIVADRYLRTSAEDVFAAGDAASFVNPALGRRIRVEHEDNANAMGRAAGLNMAGRPTPYDYLPYFYSDLFDLGYEAIGELDPGLETCAGWEEPYRKGAVYYLKDGRVRGVLLWNVWEQVDEARRLIASAGPYSRQDLEGRVPAAVH